MSSEHWRSPDGSRTLEVPLNMGVEGDVTVTLSVEALTLLLEAAGFVRVAA